MLVACLAALAAPPEPQPSRAVALGVEGQLGTRNDLGLGGFVGLAVAPRLSIELQSYVQRPTRAPEAGSPAGVERLALMPVVAVIRGELGWSGDGLGTLPFALDVGLGPAMARAYTAFPTGLARSTEAGVAWAAGPRVGFGRVDLRLRLSGLHTLEERVPTLDRPVVGERVVTRLQTGLAAAAWF